MDDGTGTMGNVEFEGRRPPPDREPAGVRTGQRLLEGVALPRQFAAGEAQVCVVLRLSVLYTLPFVR